MFRSLAMAILLLASSALYSATYPIQLTAQQTEQLAQLIWKNEGNQQLKHLTTWNKKEDFPSFGIGHFIWYPTAEKGPFKEQFPALLTYMQQQGVTLPPWLVDARVAPWQSRRQFYEQFENAQLTQLRLLLSEQLTLQADFIIQRLQQAIPLILDNSSALEQHLIHLQLQRLTTPEGVFALLDYVNFKGEGINDHEQYQGHGWGLKQVLLAMPIQTEQPLRSFGFAADEVLTRRVKNAPREENQWLAGWRVRVHAYQQLNIK